MRLKLLFIALLIFLTFSSQLAFGQVPPAPPAFQQAPVNFKNNIFNPLWWLTIPTNFIVDIFDPIWRFKVVAHFEYDIFNNTWWWLGVRPFAFPQPGAGAGGGGGAGAGVGAGAGATPQNQPAQPQPAVGNNQQPQPQNQPDMCPGVGNLVEKACKDAYQKAYNSCEPLAETDAYNRGDQDAYKKYLSCTDGASQKQDDCYCQNFPKCSIFSWCHSNLKDHPI